jgi:4-carboxymuconolactone decarboxylase
MSEMTGDQKSVTAKFEAERGTAILRGPWVPLLRSPEVSSLMLDMRSRVRDRSLLSPKLTELAILIAAREWTQQYDWSAHAGTAQREGVAPSIIAAIAEGRRPEPMADDDEEVLYDLCIELHRNKSVSDATYGRALAAFGQEGIVEAVAIEGYYALLAMVMNTARTPLPEDRTPALAPFPR